MADVILTQIQLIVWLVFSSKPKIQCNHLAASFFSTIVSELEFCELEHWS